MNKKIILFIAISGLLIIVVFVVVRLVMSDVPKKSGSAIDLNNDTVQVDNGEFSEWKTYSNQEVGISFKYPDIFERVDVQTSKGDEGQIFSGVLEFSPNHWISFGGVTADYSKTRGGSILDTQGYDKQGEKYVINFVWGKQEITPTDFWEIDEGDNRALVIQNTEIGQVLSSESVAAFINIPTSIFPGVAFILNPQQSGQPIDEKEIEIMRQIVSSVTFNR